MLNPITVNYHEGPIMAIVHPLKQYNQILTVVPGEPKLVQSWNPTTKTAEWPINALPPYVYTSLMASLQADGELVTELASEAAAIPG